MRRTRVIVRRFLAGAGGIVVALAGGCQLYEREPLDLAAHRRAWGERLVEGESVAAFSARLGDGAGAGAAGDGGFDLADGLSRGEGEVVALVFNPDLREARLRAGVTLARAEHAGLWEDPVLGLDVERILESVDDPWVVGASVGFTLPLSGRLAVEEDRAEAEHRAELRRVAATEWATRMEVRRAWLEWSAQRRLAEVARETDGRLAGVVGIVEASHRAGVLSRGEARLFAIERATRQIEWRQAESAVREAETRLRGLMGLSPAAEVALVEGPLAVDLDGGAFGADAAGALDDAMLDALASRSTEMAVRRAEYEVAEQSLRLAIRGQYPDLEIGPGLGSDEGQGRVLLGVSVPLAVWNAGRGEIAAARAEREAARGAFEAEFERQAAGLAGALARLEAARARREALEGVVVPLVEEQDAEARRLAELAQVDALLLLESLTRLSDTKAALIEARLAEAVAEIAVVEVVGPIGGQEVQR